MNRCSSRSVCFVQPLGVAHTLALAGLFTAMTGCAVTYEADDGSRHIFGFSKIEIRPPTDPVAIAGHVADVTIVGLAIHNTHEHGGLVLGYSRDVGAAIRDNVLVLGNPMQAIQPPPELLDSDSSLTGEDK